MNFSEALTHLKNGKEVRRSSWDNGAFLFISYDGILVYSTSIDWVRTKSIDVSSILANDWEVI